MCLAQGGGFFCNKPVLDFSLILDVEMPQAFRVLSWGTEDNHCAPLCWVNLPSGKKRQRSSSPGTFLEGMLIPPAFPGLLRLVLGPCVWFCHSRASRDHLSLCTLLPYSEVFLNSAGLESGETVSKPFSGDNWKRNCLNMALQLRSLPRSWVLCRNLNLTPA